MSKTEPGQDWQEWFESVWEYREDVLYPSLFGSQGRGIYTVQAEIVMNRFKQETIDPRWLHYGVFEFEPIPSRSSWLYVTSGMSNDWDAESPQPDTPSGLGCEFIFETTQQSEWAITRLLDVMTFQILLCHGRYPDHEPLSDFDRIPLRSSIWPEPSVLTYLMLAPPKTFPRLAQLESGSFDFYQIVGISEAEAVHARNQGGSALLDLLIACNVFPITNPERDEVTKA